MRTFILVMHPVRRNIRLLMLHHGLQSVLLVLPVIVAYYHDVIGLGFREFLLGEVMFSAVIVLMEVPTGWLSDNAQRRLVLAAGSFIEMTGFIILLEARSLTAVLLAQIPIGVGIGLINGTNTALLYETLLAHRLQKHFRRLEGLRMAVGFYVVAAAAVAGGFLYGVDKTLPLLIDIASFGLAALLPLLLAEPARVRTAERRNPLLDMAQTVKFAVHGHPDIGALILFCGVLFGMTQAGFWSQQPYWLARGIPAVWFGVLALAGFTLAGLASHHGHRLEKRLPRQTAFVIILVTVAGSYMLSGLAGAWWGIPFLYASSVSYGFAMPLVQDVINARIESGRRAAIISTASLAGRLTFIPVGMAVGQLSRMAGIDWTLAAMGLTLAAAGGLAMRRLARLGVLRPLTADR